MEELRKQELRKQIQEKIATFNVGDKIEFSLYDETGCNDRTGDPVEIKMKGIILNIKENVAYVEHKYGNCFVHLFLATKSE